MHKARIIVGALAAGTALGAVPAGAAAWADGGPGASPKAACWTDAKIDGKQWVRTFDKAFANPNYLKCGSPVGYLYQGSNYVYCKKWGQVHDGAYGTNHWWLYTDLDQGSKRGWVSAYFLTGPGNGDDKAVDVNGKTIKTCSKVY
ncbi:hypothetical protein E1293_27530 [Actinomadura darangshiensis]|uniref:SH3 domain-containing protein n=1 Tax=Actinomadura darangshiensis TaxID=705336 RepID=A0A4R5AZM9_9ACTN|nr:hypothetical protein [Actinomadura darangshiensis]TDD76152.1 hypothetical protein E1293_27530 [Actinomadura darangshiensis]